MARSFEFHMAQALGLDPERMQAESINVQFAGTMAQVTWSGVLYVDSPDFQAAVEEARKTFEKEMADG